MPEYIVLLSNHYWYATFSLEKALEIAESEHKAHGLIFAKILDIKQHKVFNMIW